MRSMQRYDATYNAIVFIDFALQLSCKVKLGCIFFYFYVMIPHDPGGGAFALGCKAVLKWCPEIEGDFCVHGHSLL